MSGARRRSSALTALLLIALLVGALTLVLSRTEVGAQETSEEVEIERLTFSAFGRGTNAWIEAISADGRFTVFRASDTAFTDEDDPTSKHQVFLVDRQSVGVELISRAADGTPSDGDDISFNSGLGADISDDGRYVVYQSLANDIVPVEPENDDTSDHAQPWKVFLHDRETGETRIVSRAPDGVVVDGTQPSISGDGSLVVFRSSSDRLSEQDDNGSADLYLYDVPDDTFTLVSVATDHRATGQLASHDTPQISGDGSTVVYTSQATDHVDPPTTRHINIFAWDVVAQTTRLVSATPDGTEHNGSVIRPRVSEDGGRVAFLENGPLVDGVRQASNLDDTDDPTRDLVVKDLEKGTVTVATIPPGVDDAELTFPGGSGAAHIGIDDTGTRVAFAASGGGSWEASRTRIFVHDLDAGVTFPVHARDRTHRPQLTADGFEVVFDTEDTQLADGPDTGDDRTLMASRMTTDVPPSDVATERLVFGLFDPSDGRVTDVAVTPDGRYVAFISDATDLLDIELPRGPRPYVLDRDTGELELLTVDADGQPVPDVSTGGPRIDITPDARYVAFTYSTDLDPDPSTVTAGQMVFVRDRQTGTTQQVSRDPSGEHMQGQDPSISDDSRYIAFATTHPAHPDDTNGERDTVVYDRQEQVTLLVSRHSDGTVGDDQTIEQHLSGDGSTVVFESLAKNLVDTVGDGFFNVYAHDLATRTTTLVSATSDGLPSNGDNHEPRVTSDGDHVVFLGGGRGDDPHTLDPDDDLDDVFVKEQSTGALEIVSIAPDEDVDPEDVRWPSIATDGSHVGFRAQGPGSWDAPTDPAGYIRNLATGTTVHMTPPGPDGTSYEPQHLAITDDGRSLFFADVQLFVATRVDTAAPTWPIGATLSASDVGQTVATLTWDAAEDDTGIAAYRILQDSVQVAEVAGGDTSTTITGLAPETTYGFTVVAVDDAQNATPGPSTNVTTAAGDGAATLVAEADAGGIVNLTWDPAMTADGYRILRDTGAGFETVTDVGADVLSHQDTGQPAETTLTYRIDLLDDPDVLPHTAPVSVETPPLTLDKVSWDGPRNRAQRLLLGGSVTVEAVGEPNRDVTAVVTVASWDDGDGGQLEQPAPSDIEVELSEATAGTYTGELPLIEGIAQVVSVIGTMTDGAGSAVAVTAEQPTAEVTGAIEVTLDISGGEVTDGRITAIPPTGYGAQVAVEGGPGPYRIDTLTAADDHELRLVGPDGSDLALPAAPVDVHAGLTTAADLIVSLPTSLTVDVGSSDEMPSGTVLVLDPDTGDVLDSGGVRSTGIAGPFRGLTSGPAVDVRFVPNGSTLHDEVDLVDVPLQLDPGDNLLEASVPRPPLGTIDGIVVEEASDLPVADAVVTHLYPYLDRTLLNTVTTDDEGRFSFEAPTGVGTVRVVAGAAPRVTVEDVGITAGEVTPLEVPTPSTRPIEVRLDLFTQLPDGDLVQAPMYSQQAAHFHVTTSVGSRVVAGGFYPFRRVVSLADTSILVCADGWEAGLNAACDEAAIGTDDVARARIELVWPGAAVGTLQASDGQPIGATTAWSAVVRQGTTDGHRVIDRHAGQGPAITLPLRQLGTYSIDVITDEGDRTVLEATATEGTPTVDLGSVPLDPPGPFAEFIGETEKNLDQRGSDVGIVNLVPGPDGWLDLRIDLDNAGPAVSDATLRIEHPSGARPDVEVATVNGTAVTSAVSARTIDVPLGSIDPDDRYTIRARLAVPDGFDDRLIGVRAFLLTADDRGFIGRDELPVTPLTMDVPPVVRTSSFEVGGSTRPGGSVTVFDGDDQPLARAVAAADGRWQAAVTLPDRGPWFHHRLYAELDDPDRPAVTEQTVVEIDETMPELTSLTMAQSDGRETEIELGDEPFRFPFTFNPGKELQFELTFADSSQVRDPVVVVGRGAAPAVRRDDDVFVASMSQWASGLGPIWVTNGHAIGAAIFERPPPTHAEIESWTPHLADVEIQDIAYRPEDATAETATSDPASLEADLTTALLAMADPPTAMEVQQTPTGASFSGAHQAGGGGTVDVDIDVEMVEEYTITAADATREQYSGLPVYSPSVSGSATNTTARARAVFSVPLDAVSDADGRIDPAALQPIVHAAVSGDTLLRDDGRAMVGPAPTVTLAAAGNVVRVAKVSLEVFLTAEDVRGAMGSPDVAEMIAGQHARAYACEGEAGPELQRSADRLRSRFVSGEALKLGTGVAVTGLAGTGLGAVPAAGLGVIAYALGSFLDDETAGLIDDLELAIDEAYANGECEDDGDGEGDGEGDGDGGDGDGSSATSVGDWQPSTPEGHYGKCILAAETLEQLGSCGPAPSPVADPTWIHDPSGYVFEAVPSNRLPGVTATVLQAPTAEGPWTVWDAAWFGQANPQQTDAVGRYGWDVPEGWWKVRYEADGYLTGESEVLEVLPPHFDVNVGLVDPAAPTVTDARATSDGAAIDVVFDRHMQVEDLDTTAVKLFDAGGIAVPATHAFPDAETDLSERSLATTVRLIPEVELVPGATYTVDVGSMVRSYAGTPMLDDVLRDVTLDPNTAPQGTDDAYAATEDQRLVVTAPGVLDNDLDADGHHLQAVLEDAPADGGLELAADGSFTYEPVADAAGTVTFSYRATDGSDLSDVVTVTITIAATDDVPRPVDDAYTTTGGEPLIEAAPGVLANDVDDGDGLAAILAVEPLTGTVEFTGGGDFVYTPADGFVGADRFAYRVWDGRSLSPAAWVSVEVQDATSGPGSAPPVDSGLPDWVTCPAGPTVDFPDVPEHATHAEAVGCLAALELVRGFADGTFRPGEPISRGQFASVLVRALAASGIVLPEASNPFVDVGGVHADAIAQLPAAEIIRGRTETRFEPERPVSRGQVMTLLVQTSDAFGVPLPVDGSSFTDTTGTTHGEAIARARAAGIAAGYPDGTFRPDQEVRRDQATSLLVGWLTWNVRAEVSWHPRVQ